MEVVDNFPEECRYVLETLRDVYHHDALARQQGLSPEDRLRFHQEHSGPLMKGLHEWMETQLAEHKTEPNSGLGKAISYLLNHWPKLTLFLRQPGAPIDKDYASYCTSCGPCAMFSGKRRRSESLIPCALRGGSGPGSSYSHMFLSLTG